MCTIGFHSATLSAEVIVMVGIMMGIPESCATCRFLVEQPANGFGISDTPKTYFVCTALQKMLCYNNEQAKVLKDGIFKDCPLIDLGTPTVK